MLANQDNMDFNFKYGGAFELYGADFLLSYDLNPWLIEINSSPALGATTAVTSRLCSALLEDVIKVTVDRKKSRNADTGAFELVRKLFLPAAQRLGQVEDFVASSTWEEDFLGKIRCWEDDCLFWLVLDNIKSNFSG